MVDDLQQGARLRDEGQLGRALEHFTLAAMDAEDPEDKRAGMAWAADVCLQLGRADEALAWAQALGEVSPSPDLATFLEASARMQLGEPERALELLDTVSDPSDPVAFDRGDMLGVVRAHARAKTGDDAAALDELLASVRAAPTNAATWRGVAALCAMESVDVDGIVAAIADEHLDAIFTGLQTASPLGVDRLCEAAWRRVPGHGAVLGCVEVVGSDLAIGRALAWSHRLREAGRAEHCPLLGFAANDRNHARERVGAAAGASRLFGDARGRPLLELAVQSLPDDQLAPSLHEVLELDADLADSFVAAAATTTRRSLLLALELVALGVTDGAVALLLHGLDITAHEPELLALTLATFERASLASLASLADAAGHPAAAQALLPR